MTPAGFDVFLGIDWSGSKSRRLQGVRVAACAPGNGAPVLLDGPQPGGLWRRADVFRHVLARRLAGERVLAGFDFAFAYAFDDCSAYFPGLMLAPSTPRELWAFIESRSEGRDDLYGGALYEPASPVAHHYWRSGPRPPGFVERRRRTEIACGAVTWPQPVFKCFSAANVGTGSLAGMRLLHRLADCGSIWPFDAPGGLTVVEIFPRLYVRSARVDPRRLHERPGMVDAVLVAYGSSPYAGPPLDIEDKADAVVSAAALRALSADPRIWTAPEPAARWEGWIFGVDSGKRGAP